MNPSDLKKEAERLIIDGEMPSLEELMAAIESVRAEYQPKILAVHKEARQAAREKRKL